jgi:hypothetical protein
MSTKEDRRVDDEKIRAYQNHVQALGEERDAIKEFGVMSVEAKDAEKNSRKTRRAYELWRKK